MIRTYSYLQELRDLAHALHRVPGDVCDAAVGEGDDDAEGGGLDAGQSHVHVVLEGEVGKVRAEHVREELGDGGDHAPASLTFDILVLHLELDHVRVLRIRFFGKF